MIRKRTFLVVSRSKLAKVFHSEGPRRTPVQQGLNHLDLQHSDFQARRGSRPILRLRAECQHETDPSVDFEPEISVCVGNSA